MNAAAETTTSNSTVTTADTLPPQVFHFTPSLMGVDVLEAMLVQREPLAQRLTDGIRDGVTGGGKQHAYLIGPRGIGKTHLMALTYHRIKAMTDLQDKIRIAWLREEEWGTDSFTTLLLGICRALKEEYPSEFPDDRLEQVYDAPNPEKFAQSLLEEFVGKRTMLLLAENMDEIFDGIKDKGQRSFRSFLQETAFTTIVATSQRLSNSLSKQTAPFYQFFNVEHLSEFSVDDAVLLLKNLAELRHDNELADFVNSPTGRARVRAVNHLAGGNPRLYVIFSDFLTREALDDLVKPFLRMLDELTPYYQARIASLSTQQQKIVAFLCDNAAPATVKEIARRCLITQQTASSQLKDLKEKNYVCDNPLGPTGRDTYYELCEPLMRLCLEVKKSRSGPIKLMIEFLRLWYPVPELRYQLNVCKSNTPIEHEYLTRALELAETLEDPRIRQCQVDINSYMVNGLVDKALLVADELVAIAPNEMTYQGRGGIHFVRGDVESALKDLEQAIAINPENAFAWINKAACLNLLGDREQSLECLKEATRIDADNASAWRELAAAHLSRKQYEEARKSVKKSLRIQNKDSYSWFIQGEILSLLKKTMEASKSFDKAISLDNSNWEYWLAKIRLLDYTKEAPEFFRVINEALSVLPENPVLWLEKATTLVKQKKFIEADVSYVQSINFGNNVCCVYLGHAEALIGLERFDAAVAELHSGLDAIRSDDFDDKEKRMHIGVHTVPILENLLLFTSNIAQWGKQAKNIVTVYEKYGFLLELAPALSSRKLLRLQLSSSTSQEAVEMWNDAWRKALVPYALSEFDLPLRLMQTAVDYKAGRDKKVLLRLPVEERKIIESVLAEAAKEPYENRAGVISGSVVEDTAEEESANE